MKLWIRSQDREQLRKIVDLKYQYGTLQDANLKVIVGTTQYDEWDVLGKYKTKERALEVLDEIQKFIEEFNTVTAELDEYGDVTNVEHHKKVYQMPNE